VRCGSCRRIGYSAAEHREIRGQEGGQVIPDFIILHIFVFSYRKYVGECRVPRNQAKKTWPKTLLQKANAKNLRKAEKLSGFLFIDKEYQKPKNVKEFESANNARNFYQAKKLFSDFLEESFWSVFFAWFRGTLGEREYHLPFKTRISEPFKEGQTIHAVGRIAKDPTRYACLKSLMAQFLELTSTSTKEPRRTRTSLCTWAFDSMRASSREKSSTTTWKVCKA
jgi:hypothetical protein